MKKKTKISPRKAPKQSRSKGLVETILTATTRVLTKQGYEHATTNRVAEAAGVSIGSLYQYFPSKEALIGAVIDRTLAANSARFEAELDRGGLGTLEQAVEYLVREGVKLYTKNRPLIRILFEQAPRLERMQNLIRARRLVAGSFARALEKYGVRVPNPELSTYVMLNAAMGVIQTSVFYLPDGVTDDELVGEVTRLVLGYLNGFRNP